MPMARRTTSAAGPTTGARSVAAWLDPFTAADAPAALWQIGVTRRAEEVASDPDQGGPVVATLAEAIDAWNTRAVANARGIIAILDNATYAEDLTIDDLVIALPGGARLAIVGAGWPAEPLGGGGRRRRPGVLAPQDRRPHVASNLRVQGTAQPVEAAGTLILDGLLVEGKIAVEAGDLGRIELRHATVGAAASALGPALEVGASNTRLNVLIDHSMAGPIATGAAGGRVCICDSTVGEDRVADGNPLAMPLVIDAPSADLVIGRVNVFGRTVGRTLEADDTIFVGVLAIARRQSGCIRFSYVPEPSRTPRRYRCTPDLQIAQAKERLGVAFGPADEQALRERIRPGFVTTVLGDAAFAQLARRCPAEIAEGAEGGREMGAMNTLGNPLRLANLRDALDEYLPFGLTAGVTFVT